MKHKINVLILQLLLLVTCLLMYEQPYFYIMIISITALFLTILITGVLFMKFNYFLKSITRLKSSKVLLTFDDGPHPKYTPLILDTLLEHKVKAIFFIVGKRLKNHPEIGKRIIKEGHIIGNHSQEHNPMISTFSRKRLMKEICDAQNTILESTLFKTSIFRPPIGYTNPNYSAVLRELNMKCIGWTLRSYDSIYKTPHKLVKRLIHKTKPGNIVLLHDNLSVTCSSLENYITEAKSNGIIFVSSEEIKTILDE